MQRLGEILAAWSRRYTPDSFVFALLLTVIVYGLALALTDHGPVQLLQDWYQGFWSLLSFAMQMVLILVTGYALASSPVVRSLLSFLARSPRNGRQAVALVALVSGLLGWFNWGLSLIAGGLLAREVAKAAKTRGLKVHYPLLAAGGYMGLLVWHGGLSGSAPLLVNTTGHFLEDRMGMLSLEETIFRSFSLSVTAGILLVAPLILMRLHPPDAEVEEIPPEDRSPEAPAVKPEAATFAERLENSRALVWPIGLAGLLMLVLFLARHGLLKMDLNVMNFALLMLGLLLHGTPRRFAQAVVEGARASSGVILQFPFYAGIMGIMGASGLVVVIAEGIVSVSTPLSYPFWTLVSAALVNLAVPSGGGQWAVQGPIVLEASQQLGVDLGRSVMAVAFGDQLTNMIQPFWALPLLGITRLKAGEVLGYTAVVMAAAFIIMAAGITFLP